MIAQSNKSKAYDYFYSGLNSKEIATILDLPISTIEGYISKGKWSQTNINIKVGSKMIEKFNYFFNIALESARNNKEFLKQIGLKANDLNELETFRQKVLHSFLNH